MPAATGKSSKTGNDGGASPDLDADIRQLRADIARLTEQLNVTGEHSYRTARRAAKEGVEQLKVQSEAAMEGLRSNAKDLEEQILTAVREKPVTSLAIAAGIGFLFAMMSRR
ncbi:ElaB/YqjD/DUF883 family membrane-anchored ribosome-binding protein [Mesorhizobium soli]|jgi:ElaB/YqjD/DUF883 family membrane-anchored ribosome-binding protein|uniref:DUF883 family protein n=1 Tax=Pseudaminobacter soli (ex Li et al. 2025) TaxID=1295366 RepID=UPI002473B33E|nr:hypothetical protein [Mesorhizobium soli]MDH6234165.1 ElaB/YqjD/DUF883 family membrane-anchored ribosome-binding protein [Mesorhizobium soli]